MPMANSRQSTIKKNLRQFPVALALQELSLLSPSRWTGPPLPSSSPGKTLQILRWHMLYHVLEQIGECSICVLIFNWRPTATRDDPTFKRMVDLCENRYYAGKIWEKNIIFFSSEFFWFPNHGSEEGFWQNCWNNDGQENQSVTLNTSTDFDYQVSDMLNVLGQFLHSWLQPSCLGWS